MASIHEILSPDDLKTKNFEEKDDEQASPGVESALIEEEEDWPTNVGKNQTHPTIHDSSSNTFLSQK